MSLRSSLRTVILRWQAMLHIWYVDLIRGTSSGQEAAGVPNISMSFVNCRPAPLGGLVPRSQLNETSSSGSSYLAGPRESHLDLHNLLWSLLSWIAVIGFQIAELVRAIIPWAVGGRGCSAKAERPSGCCAGFPNCSGNQARRFVRFSMTRLLTSSKPDWAMPSWEPSRPSSGSHMSDKVSR